MRIYLLKKQGEKLKFFFKFKKSEQKNKNTDKVYFDTYMQQYLNFTNKKK